MKQDNERTREYDVQVSISLVLDGEIKRCVGHVLLGSECETLRAFRALVLAMDSTVSELNESSDEQARVN